MASLMENLILILEEEEKEYQILVGLSRRKSTSIIKSNLEELNAITAEEQTVADRVSGLEKRRMIALSDIAEVINRDVNHLNLKVLTEMLGSRPDEQKKVAAVHDKLQQTLREMVNINEHNKMLLKNALEIVEFDLNLARAMNAAPQVANYNGNACNTESYIHQQIGGFDTKQ